ncbi:MAG: DUF4421 domain-containing protein [Muribaculaceae bacterium]|nr:DUF4421 domain-containing protein [Muribaculaceae bacterium]
MEKQNILKICVTFILFSFSSLLMAADKDSLPASDHTSFFKDTYLASGPTSALTPPLVDAKSLISNVPEKLKGYEPSFQERWWWNQLKTKHTLNINDTTIIYPKFLKFCLDVYHWADHFFNYYDPEYVVGTGKRWKARIVNDNWADTHIMTFPQHMKMDMLSQLYANMGAYIQYMAVSLGYTFDFNNIAHDKAMDHSKMEFGFNCSLFDVNLYYHENTGGTYLRRFGDYRRGEFFKERFPGVKFYTFGIDAMYFFNHNRYSHGAAYNFSKFQKKSQGSFITGFSYSNNDITFDFTQLPLELLPYLTIPVSSYHFHYKSYALIAGYGFNWVVNPRLLINGTLTPSFGVTHCYEDSLEGEKYMPSMNIAGRSSITYNLGNFFFSGISRFNGHWYRSSTYSLFSSIINFSANIGYRF